jgi:hypothetical protein
VSQEKAPELRPGRYGALELAKSPDGHVVTGYYADATGYDEHTQAPRFTCAFFFAGRTDQDPSAIPLTAHFDDEPHTGTLTILSETEIRVQLDIEAIEWTGDDLTGTVINPHNIVVGGPASVRAVCLEEDGMPTTVMSSFTDRDTIEPEGASTFTIEPPVSLNCAGILAAASGRVRD